MIEIGLRANFRRPKNPKYLDRQPADHSRTQYSTPKNITRNISCNSIHIKLKNLVTVLT